MRKFTILVSLLVVYTLSLSAVVSDTTVWEFDDYTIFPDPSGSLDITEVSSYSGGLKIYAQDGNAVTFDKNSDTKSYYKGKDFTQRLKLNGSRKFVDDKPSYRIVGVPVYGPCEIKVLAASGSSSDNRSIVAVIQSDLSVLDTLDAFGQSVQESTFRYEGSGIDTVLVFSPSSSVNLFSITRILGLSDLEPDYSTVATWNLSALLPNVTTDFDETFTLASDNANRELIVLTTSDKPTQLEVRSSARYYNGIAYGARFELGGSGSTSDGELVARSIGIPVDGQGGTMISKVNVYCMSSNSSSDRVGYVRQGRSGVDQEFVLYAGDCIGEYSFEYTGSGQDTMFVYSSGGGSNYYSFALLEASASLPTALSEKGACTDLSIYPNPSNGSFIVANQKGAKLEVVNLDGRVIYSKSNISANEQVTIDAKSGIYLIKVGELVNKIAIK